MAHSQTNVKIVIVGDGAVGKTCICASYANNTFPEDYIPTIHDNYPATVIIDGKSIKVGIYDTAGQSEYDLLRPLGYPQTGAFILCFSIDNQASYNNVYSKWWPELRHYGRDVPIILVGTKVDLRGDRKTIDNLKSKNESLIRFDQGVALGKRIKASRYLECSALTQKGLREIFDEAVRASFRLKETAKTSRCHIL